MPGGKNEYYLWQMGKYLHELRLLQRRSDIMAYASDLGLHFTANIWHWISVEWPIWIKCYTPSVHLTKDSLVLDAGAGEGETLLFFYKLGLRRFRCIELDPAKFRVLENNAHSLPEATCELENRAFAAHDAIGVDFAKVDVEGGEMELLKVRPSELPNEIVLETHSPEIAEALKRHLGGMTYSMNWERGVDMWRFLNHG